MQSSCVRLPSASRALEQRGRERSHTSAQRPGAPVLRPVMPSASDGSLMESCMQRATPRLASPLLPPARFHLCPRDALIGREGWTGYIGYIGQHAAALRVHRWVKSRRTGRRRELDRRPTPDRRRYTPRRCAGRRRQALQGGGCPGSCPLRAPLSEDLVEDHGHVVHVAPRGGDGELAELHRRLGAGLTRVWARGHW